MLIAGGSQSPDPKLPIVWTLVDLEQGTARLLDTSTDNNLGSGWSPDGRYLTIADDNSQLVGPTTYIWDVEGD